MTFPYPCPTCQAVIRTERFGTEGIFCPVCGDGPFRTAHDCFYDTESGDENCSDTLVRPEPEVGR